jgi:exodeoxyribonuclease III
MSEDRPLLRVISYNLLEGFQDRPERKPGALAWIKEMRPDILGLLEMNGYTHDALAADARQWGHPHSILVKTEGYSPALSSLTPIEQGIRIVTGLTHGMVAGHTCGMDVIVLHLDARSCQTRQYESAIIIQRIKDSLQARRPTLVMGDFNALSRTDEKYYAASSGVLDHMKRLDRERNWTNTKDGRLDFDVVQAFIAVGLIDLVAEKTGGTLERLSFPTPLMESDAKAESYFRRRMRLDYILASPDLAERCRRAAVLNGETTAAFSDHYPVLAEFDS